MESDACSGDGEGEEVEEEIFNGCAHKPHLLTRASWRDPSPADHREALSALGKHWWA